MLNFAHELGVDVVRVFSFGPQIGQGVEVFQNLWVFLGSFDVLHSHFSDLLNSLWRKAPPRKQVQQEQTQSRALAACWRLLLGSLLL